MIGIETLPVPALAALAGGLFVAGASLTSFAGLAVDRLPHQLGWRENPKPNLNLVSPPSRCEGCGVRIRWPHLLPIAGYCLARGRCGSCAMRVLPAYPLLELLGGLGTLGMAAWGWQSAGMAGAIAAPLLFLLLLFLAWMDWREHWLPEVVTLPLFWAGLAFSPFESGAESRIFGALVGFVLTWGAMKWVGYRRGEDVLAGGDIALTAAAGAWLGITLLPLFLLASSLIFIAYALPARRKGRLFMPMGPALALAFLLCLWGKNFYLSLMTSALSL